MIAPAGLYTTASIIASSMTDGLLLSSLYLNYQLLLTEFRSES
jgi:hypothetical protein